MGFNRFGLQLTLRLTLLLLALGGSGYLLATAGYPAATLLMLLTTALLAAEVFRFVRKTNLELSRFLDAARYADFGQRFEFPELGAGFSELGETFTRILERFRDDRKSQEAELRHLRAILEHVPVPLLTVFANDNIRLWNNAARRLFGAERINHLSDLATFGVDLPELIRAIQPGERILMKFQLENVEQTLAVVSSEITLASRTEKLISLLNIQSELDGMQVAAWQDLVRVLTHEIMNSITPISSLARTAADLVDDVAETVHKEHDGSEELLSELTDIADAVGTVARRSDGLMGFVSSYRQLTRLPDPKQTEIRLAELFEDVSKLGTIDWSEHGIRLHISIQPPGLMLSADRQMISQVLINLLQNSAHALGTQGGDVWLSGRLGPRGMPQIAVRDSGPGVPAELLNQIFVPFFTTRKDGSGVGLAFSRQVMIAHGGTITCTQAVEGGACFTLRF